MCSPSDHFYFLELPVIQDFRRKTMCLVWLYKRMESAVRNLPVLSQGNLLQFQGLEWEQMAAPGS